MWVHENDDFNSEGASGVPAMDADPLLMPQMSMWTDFRSLRHFVYKSDHKNYLKRRNEWFEKIPAPYSVCWFRPVLADPPTLAEAFKRLDYLKENGQNQHAFGFSKALKMEPPALANWNLPVTMINDGP